MNKHDAHFQAFGYEPLRMKPAHFASGFFTALTGQVYADELLNRVAVTSAGRGMLGNYAPERVLETLKDQRLIEDGLNQPDVELLRKQVNGIVDNDSAMFPAYRPFSARGNDYTFISPRLLSTASRVDGFAGFFVLTVLADTGPGRTVLDTGRALADEPAGTLEQFVEPLLGDIDPQPRDLRDKYEERFGVLDPARVAHIAAAMRVETDALERLCAAMQDYSHYRKIRFYILGLLAWLFAYLLKTAASTSSATPLLFFDFLGDRHGRIRSQSRACYARLREGVRRSYTEFARAGRIQPDPIAENVFSRKGRPEEQNFYFLEEHFRDVAVRMGYAQPRAGNVQQKHLELQPDTLRILMLSILDGDVQHPITLDEACTRLWDTWKVLVGARAEDHETLRTQGYFGFDEEDLSRNAAAFADRLKSLHMAFEPSDGLVLCSTDIGKVL